MSQALSTAIKCPGSFRACHKRLNGWGLVQEVRRDDLVVPSDRKLYHHCCAEADILTLSSASTSHSESGTQHLHRSRKKQNLESLMKNHTVDLLTESSHRVH